MVNLKTSKYKVYYLYDYIPERKRDNYNSIEISEKLIDYKNGDDDAIDFFSEKIMEAISYLSNNVMESYVRNLALVSIPPSKVDKYSPIKRAFFKLKDGMKMELPNQSLIAAKTFSIMVICLQEPLM